MNPVEIGSCQVALNQLDHAARLILDSSPKQSFFTFSGDLGAGKTTLIKAVCKELGTNDVVSSPTFSLVNEYVIPGVEKSLVYHFDFYRIENIDEVYDIGYEEYFYSEHFCFIEWPEKIEALLPESYIEIRISAVEGAENRREITIFKHSANK